MNLSIGDEVYFPNSNSIGTVVQVTTNGNYLIVSKETPIYNGYYYSEYGNRMDVNEPECIVPLLQWHRDLIELVQLRENVKGALDKGLCLLSAEQLRGILYIVNRVENKDSGATDDMDDNMKNLIWQGR